MKQRKQSSHNEKQTSSLERKIVKNNNNQHTNKHEKHSVSVIYESGRSIIFVFIVFRFFYCESEST